MEPNKDNKIPDLYEYMGLSVDAKEEDIKKAYKALAKKYHPDKTTGSHEKFQELNAVYEILSDPQKKQTYDHFKRAGIHMPSNVNEMSEESRNIAINFFIGTNIGALYALIAISVSIIFNVPLTTAFFPSLSVFIAPVILNANPQSLAFAVGGLSGMLALPFYVIGITAGVSKRLLEAPINYFRGVENGGDQSGDGQKASTMLVLDENDFEFINKQKAEYEKIDEIERNWTFLTSENNTNTDSSSSSTSTSSFTHKDIFEKAIDNIIELITVIEKHFDQQHPSYESDLILKKLEETNCYYKDMEYIMNINPVDSNERDSQVLFKYHKNRLIKILDQCLLYIKDASPINTNNNNNINNNETPQQQKLNKTRLLSLVKNTEILLEEFVFNQFEYYQI